MENIKIINILKDGTVIDDIGGYIIPLNDKTKRAYILRQNIITNSNKKITDN